MPKTWFLHQVNPVSEDLSNYVLKPLYSFAGTGVIVGPTRENLAAIPEAERPEYILQERVDFVPLIETPHGPTKAELRIMYVWVDALRPRPGADGSRKNDGCRLQPRPAMGGFFSRAFPGRMTAGARQRASVWKPRGVPVGEPPEWMQIRQAEKRSPSVSTYLLIYIYYIDDILGYGYIVMSRSQF